MWSSSGVLLTRVRIRLRIRIRIRLRLRIRIRDTQEFNVSRQLLLPPNIHE